MGPRRVHKVSRAADQRTRGGKEGRDSSGEGAGGGTAESPEEGAAGTGRAELPNTHLAGEAAPSHPISCAQGTEHSLREEEEEQEGWARQHREELERQEGEQGWHSRVRSHLGHSDTGVTPDTRAQHGG